MAVSPIIPLTVEVRLLWSLSGQLGVNVLHAIAPGGYVVNQTTTNALATGIKTAFTTNLSTLMNPSVALARIGLRDMRQANQAEFLDSNAVIGGVTAGDMLPAQNAVCVTLRTAQSGKSFRGRVYISGWLETQNDLQGTTVQGASTAAAAFVTGISAAMTNATLQLAVASRAAEAYEIVKTTHHNDGSETVEQVGRGNARAAVSTPVTLIQSRTNAWESQRRRQNSRGALPSVLTAVASFPVELA